MKKEYMRPEITVQPMPSEVLLAGSLNPGDQSDPTLAPLNDDLDEMLIMSCDPFCSLLGL
jgi:hypothetical protein